MRLLGPAYRKVILCLWAFFFSAFPLNAADLTPSLDGFVQNGGFITTIEGTVLDAHREHERFVPASTIKIATALAALQVLGPSYRFKTEFFLEGGSHLVIRGHGDPFLTSEYIRKIGLQLISRGISTLDMIIIDNSLFALEGPVDGSTGTSNPYDAPNGPLIVNFNSLPVVCDQNFAVSGEPQTPVLPMMKEICSALPDGYHRVNVSAFSGTDTPAYSRRYSCELFSAIFQELGISTGKQCKEGVVSNQSTPVYTYFSEKKLADQVAACLEYSNNYMANQLLLTCGGATFGYPATWEKARRSLEKVLSEDPGIDAAGISLYEGSGLSPKNRISPSSMISVLEAFKPFSHLLPRQQNILIKSGTMSGVFCYVGYFTSEEKIDPFVIFLNQQENTRKDVLHLLYDNYLRAINRLKNNEYKQNS